MVQRPYPPIHFSPLPSSFLLASSGLFHFFFLHRQNFLSFFLPCFTHLSVLFPSHDRSSTRFFLHKQQVINRCYSGRSYLPYLVETLLFSSMRVLERDDSYPPLPPPRITLSNVLLVCCAISWPTMIGDNIALHG